MRLNSAGLICCFAILANQAGAMNCYPPEGEIAELVCENDELLSKDEELAALIEEWRLGPNPEMVEEFSGSPPDFSQALSSPDLNRAELSACGRKIANEACLNAQYDFFLKSYSSLKEEKTGLELDGIKYSGLIGAGKGSKVEIYVDDRLIDVGFEPYSRKFMEQFVKAPRDVDEYSIDEECFSCRLEVYRLNTLYYEDERILITEIFESEYEGGAHPTYSYESPVYDMTSMTEIGFSGLFQAEKWKGVKADIIDQIIVELNNLEMARQERDGDDQVLYFTNVREMLEALPDEDWNKIAFRPDLAGGQIIGFRVQSDDFEFAPHAYGGYYTDLTISITQVMIDAFKPEYLPSFSEL